MYSRFLIVFEIGKLARQVTLKEASEGFTSAMPLSQRLHSDYPPFAINAPKAVGVSLPPLALDKDIAAERYENLRQRGWG